MHRPNARNYYQKQKSNYKRYVYPDRICSLIDLVFQSAVNLHISRCIFHLLPLPWNINIRFLILFAVYHILTAQSSPKEEFLFSALSPTHTLPDAQKKGRRMSFLYDSHLLCMNLLFSAVCEILPFSRSKSLFLRCKFLLQIFYCSFLFFRIKPHHHHVHYVRRRE